MSTPLHSAATDHVPFFITAPGKTDVLLVGVGIFLLVAVLAVGVLFLRLHTLPERLAHKGQKMQFEVVAVLGLLALFTHMHIFWVAGLLLALIDLPDFGTPLRRMAGALERLAGVEPEGSPANVVALSADHGAGDAATEHVPAIAAAKSAPERAKPVLTPVIAKESTHA